MYRGILYYSCLQFSGNVGNLNFYAYSGLPTAAWISISHVIGNDSNPKSLSFFRLEEHLCLHGYDQKCYFRFEKFFHAHLWRGNEGQCSLWKKENYFCVFNQDWVLLKCRSQSIVIMKFFFVHLLVNFSNNFVVAKCQLCSAYISTPNKA